MRYLTQFTQNNRYVQSQVEYLAASMKVTLTIDPHIRVGDIVTVQNQTAAFTFMCLDLDSRPDCCAHSYELLKVRTLLPAMVGAQIVVSCSEYDMYRQGDIATLIRNEGVSGWWAKFKDGEEWNVGTGWDFIVVSSA